MGEITMQLSHLFLFLPCHLGGRGGGTKDYCTVMSLHIGKEIEDELRWQGRGVTWFAQCLHCDRTNVYNIFKREGIDTRLLERISMILHRNFFALYCQEDSIEDENISTEV